ncbi:MAG: DUF3857 domain-containing protein [Vicinamibacteria bacterium]
MFRKSIFFGAVFALGAGAASFAAEKLPPISQADRDLKVAPGEPSASAVFLIQRGTIHLRNFSLQDASSTIGVQARLKVLKEEGKSHAEIVIPHSDYLRLSRFEGRTITPDGKVIKVDSKGKFKRKVSETTKRLVTSIAFPSVEVGSILEYEYELNFNSFYYVEPWYFMDEIPVLQSEVTWEIPNQLKSRVWTVPNFGADIKLDQKQRTGFIEAKFYASNLPSTPSEIYGLPFRDQAARMMVVPMAYRDQDVNLPLLESWAAVAEGIDKDYLRAQAKPLQVALKATSLTVGKEGDEKAEALRRFVRDEITTLPDYGAWVEDTVTVDKVLAKGEGTPVAKALLLQSLLAAVDIPSQLIWAADRRRGAVLGELPNPGFFDRVLVRLSNGVGSGVFLDPVDRSLGYGRLSPYYEGTVAIVHDAKKPETITLPITSFITHTRYAKLDLAIDAEGRAAGKGELALKGHYAWEQSFSKRSAEETKDFWQKWAEGAMPGYRITALTIVDRPDEGALKVGWAMAATEESVLGDEVSFVPSRPIGPLRQPFTVTESERRSPVMLDHSGVEEIEVNVTWPKGWSPVAPPQSAFTDAGIAAYRVDAKVDPATNSLNFKRRFEIRKREPKDRVEFAALRNLYTEAEKRDAQTLVIAHR